MTKRTIGAGLATSTLVVAVGFGVAAWPSPRTDIDFQSVRTANTGLGMACEYSDYFSAKPECQTSEKPRILVWGDSYAMHLVPGIRASTDLGVIQATRATCGPFVGISMFSPTGWYNREWAEKCIKFNQDVLAHLARNPSIDTVVLGSLYGQYLKGNRVLKRGESQKGKEFALTEVQGSEDLAAQALTDTVRSIRKLGRRVVLVTPPPAASGVDFGRCLEMKSGGKVFFGADRPDCAIPEPRYRAGAAPVRALIERVAREADVGVVRLDEWMCHDGVCAVAMYGVPLYRDNGHLSVEGSRLLGQEMGLAERLLAAAR